MEVCARAFCSCCSTPTSDIVPPHSRKGSLAVSDGNVTVRLTPPNRILGWNAVHTGTWELL